MLLAAATEILTRDSDAAVRKELAQLASRNAHRWDTQSRCCSTVYDHAMVDFLAARLGDVGEVGRSRQFTQPFFARLPQRLAKHKPRRLFPRGSRISTDPLRPTKLPARRRIESDVHSRIPPESELIQRVGNPRQHPLTGIFGGPVLLPAVTSARGALEITQSGIGRD